MALACISAGRECNGCGDCRPDAITPFVPRRGRADGERSDALKGARRRAFALRCDGCGAPLDGADSMEVGGRLCCEDCLAALI